ncbi:hypothetical protein GUJ93_ZPchr0006g42193 [Zizania palustris]|uniref:Uroporphyrinogen-III synthase n=1 Tax=Zizania palustris TaxID=103762 RepID=A0A8J5VNI8_ZIZPA|nr:hypothetical protein GUJ93_ZPchr0006g42193 [Zizania palustris]
MACSSPPPDVVVIRDQGKNGKLIAALEMHNIQTLELPLIKHVQGPDTDRLSEFLRNEKFDWIAIRSPDAAAVFLEGWKAARSPKVWIAVVGAGTTTMFDEVMQSDDGSLEVAFSLSKAMGKVLASEWLQSFQGPLKLHAKCYILHLQGLAMKFNGLSLRGFEVTRLNTYMTVPVQDVDPLILKPALSAPVVAVASPSALRAWLNLISQVDNWGNSIACIGDASAVKKFCLKSIYYPTTLGLDGWVESILEALRAHGQPKEAPGC